MKITILGRNTRTGDKKLIFTEVNTISQVQEEMDNVNRTYPNMVAETWGVATPEESKFLSMEDIKKFDWEDLDNKVLRISVVKSRDKVLISGTDSDNVTYLLASNNTAQFLPLKFDADTLKEI